MIDTNAGKLRGLSADNYVPRGTIADFEAWNENLIKWNKKINLVAPGEIPHFWDRHARDSWQLVKYLPESWTRIVDLGSGGGFPGLALGIHAKQRGQGEVHLVESVGKKATFLKTMTRELSLPVTVHAERIEDIAPLAADVVAARAFAPLPKLFSYAKPHLTEHAVLILPKGETAETEISAARKDWTFDVERFESKTHPDGRILRVTRLESRA